jgi:hypothetical protein
MLFRFAERMSSIYPLTFFFWLLRSFIPIAIKFLLPAISLLATIFKHLDLFFERCSILLQVLLNHVFSLLLPFLAVNQGIVQELVTGDAKHTTGKQLFCKRDLSSNEAKDRKWVRDMQGIPQETYARLLLTM